MLKGSPAWRSFRMTVKAERTWTGYAADFQRFLEHVTLGSDALVERAQDPMWFEQQVTDFLWIHRQRAEAKEITANRVWRHLSSFLL